MSNSFQAEESVFGVYVRFVSAFGATSAEQLFYIFLLGVICRVLDSLAVHYTTSCTDRTTNGGYKMFKCRSVIFFFLIVKTF